MGYQLQIINYFEDFVYLLLRQIDFLFNFASTSRCRGWRRYRGAGERRVKIISRCLLHPIPFLHSPHTRSHVCSSTTENARKYTQNFWPLPVAGGGGGKLAMANFKWLLRISFLIDNISIGKNRIFVFGSNICLSYHDGLSR